MSTGEFEFVIQGTAEDWYRLDFRIYDEQAKPWFSSVWQRMVVALEAAHKQTETNMPEWAQWKPWDWCEKKRPGYEPRQTIVAWCGGQMAGFMNVWSGIPSQIDTGEMTLYIEHVAAAPWNQNTELWRRKYRQTGTAMLAYAIKMSQDQAMGGRVSLHASNDSALAFYRKVAENRTPELFYGEKSGVTGPTPHGNLDVSKTYLETTPAGAINFLEDYRNA